MSSKSIRCHGIPQYMQISTSGLIRKGVQVINSCLLLKIHEMNFVHCTICKGTIDFSCLLYWLTSICMTAEEMNLGGNY